MRNVSENSIIVHHPDRLTHGDNDLHRKQQSYLRYEAVKIEQGSEVAGITVRRLHQQAAVAKEQWTVMWQHLHPHPDGKGNNVRVLVCIIVQKKP